MSEVKQSKHSRHSQKIYSTVIESGKCWFPSSRRKEKKTQVFYRSWTPWFLTITNLIHWIVSAVTSQERERVALLSAVCCIDCGNCCKAIWTLSPENNGLLVEVVSIVYVSFLCVLVCPSRSVFPVSLCLLLSVSGIRTNTRRQPTCWMMLWPSERRPSAGTIQL